MKTFFTRDFRALQFGLSALSLLTITACGGGNGDVVTSQQTASVPFADLSVESTPPAPLLASAMSDGPLNNMTSVLSKPRVSNGENTFDELPDATPSSLTPSFKGEGATIGPLNKPQVVYVALNGNDAWSGRLPFSNGQGTDGPVKTLQVAQQRARSKLSTMTLGTTPRAAVRIMIAPGTYALTSPLALTQADSGTPDAPVSYEAITPGTVTVSGGTTLVPRTAASAGQPAVFEVPASAQSAWNGGGQLFVNGRRATLARQPNAGQYYFVQQATILPTEAPGAQGRAAFVPSADALSWMNGLPSADRSRAVVNVMHAWTSSQHHFASSAPAGSVQVAPSANWTFLVSGVSQRYFIENVPQALDAPGEWFWDASGVRYIPAADEAGLALTAVMPVLPKLVTISGDMNQQQWAQNIAFKGLTFAHTRYLTPSNGFLDSQAASYVGAAIEVDNAKNIQIDNCTVTGVAGYGVWFRREVRDSKITNSNLTDLGAGGVQMGQQSQSVTDPIQTGNNWATGNRIGNTGKIFPGAVGLWVGQSFDNTVANNLIYNTTYSGISVGWTWGYGTATSGNNKITNNLLANIGMGMMSDMGGIYTVGIAPGTTLSGNVIREVRGYTAYGAGAWGIYQDGGTSQTVVENNIVVGADNGTYTLSSGRYNTVRNNLQGLGDRQELMVFTPDPSNTPLTFTGNLMIPKTVLPFSAYATSPNTVFSGNTVSSGYAPGAVNLTACGAGCTSTNASVNLTSDPRGIAVVGADTATINRFAQAAAQSGPTNLANASSVVTVAAELPPVVVAPPIPFTIDIANAPLGTQPMGFWYSKPGTNTAITIVENTQSPNGRCLRYADSPSNANSYDPHTYAALNHDSGTTTGEFSMLIDAGTNFTHQWRDTGVPVLTGPSLVVTAAGVKVNNVLVAPVTVGQWMKFRVIAPLATPNGKWTLQVINEQGQTTTANNLPFVHSGWGKLHWWGFISGANTSTNFCLNSVQATNVQ